MSREFFNAVVRKVKITGVELNPVLKRVMTQLKMESRVAIACIRTKLKRDDSKTIQNFAACCTMLCNCMAEVCHNPPGTASPSSTLMRKL